jgi:fatty-acid peroxygenase
MLAMIDVLAAVGARWRRGRMARGRRRVGSRANPSYQDPLAASSEGLALQVIASHRDETGSPLDEHVAAAALVNVLRATVAIHLETHLGGWPGAAQDVLVSAPSRLRAGTARRA